MVKLQDQTCGTCAHFGADSDDTPTLIQLRVRGEAPEDLVESCGRPEHEELGLRVSVLSSCEGFTPAKAG